MKSIGKCLSEKYVLNGIIESHFSDAYAYIFDYMFNFILYNLSLLTLGFLFHHPIAVTIYIIITGSLRAVTGGYHCKTRISCYILSYTVFCNGVQREHNKKLNNGLPILHKVPPKRDYGRYFCIMAEKGGTSHGGLTEKLSPFFHAKKQEVNAYGR